MNHDSLSLSLSFHSDRVHYTTFPAHSWWVTLEGRRNDLAGMESVNLLITQLMYLIRRLHYGIMDE